MIKKTASWRIVVTGLATYLLLQLIFWGGGVSGAYDPLSGVLSGSLLFGMMFMATDPISASQTTDTGRFIYGGMIGILTALIRTFSVWPEAITFSILLANMFAPLINYLIQENRRKKKAKAAGKDAT